MAESAVVTAPTTPPVGRRPVSPAAHLAARFAAADVLGPRAVAVREVPFLTMVGVRVSPGTAVADRIGTQLRTGLPTSCGAVGTGDGGTVLWLAPDEFLVVSDQEPEGLTDRLRGALQDAPGSVIDLSANRTTFELAGPSARLVLEKGCPLDLHPRAFAVGRACLTMIGAVPVVLWKTADQAYRILPRSSYADFLGRWLIDAMVEFRADQPC